MLSFFIFCSMPIFNVYFVFPEGMASMKIDVQWCGYKAVEEGILTAELCLQIHQMFDGDCDLQTFAQTILDNGLCKDMEKVQQLMNEAYTLSKQGEFPPVNYFEKQVSFPSSGATSPATEPSEKTAAPTPVQQPSKSTPMSTGSGKIPSIDGIENKSDDDVRQVMVDFLTEMRKLAASDFHISADFVPFARVNLKLQSFGETRASQAASTKLNTVFLNDKQKADFEENGDLDYCLTLDALNRFRVNLMKHKDGPAGTYRLIPNRVSTLDELGFTNTEKITKLLDYHNGLILVTGAIGSGKTTTLASLIDVMNNKRYDHIITVENPIEIVQMSNKCNVTQREVGSHTVSFASALKGALREDPDIIVIGELRDLETIEMAITASETGHLVIGTLHTSDAGSTLSRLMDVFPPSQQQQIRSMVAESLKGIICQQLIPRIEGGNAVALEILINNTAVGKNIRENTTHQLKNVIETGQKQGMCTMDQSIFALYDQGIISKEDALARIASKNIINKIENPPPPPGSEEEESAPKKKRFGFG